MSKLGSRTDLRSQLARLLAMFTLASLGAFMAPACGDSDAAFRNPNPPGDCEVAGSACAALCDASGGCVDCVSDSDCGVASPFCVDGDCEDCLAAVDCGAGQSCFPKDHECRDTCTDATDCTEGDEPLCDSATGACVGCFDASDCGADDPICSATTKQCVECGDASDCPAAEPFCDEGGECRDCLVDSDCGAGELCVSRHCEAACQSDADCPNGDPICDSGDCVECVSDNDCGPTAPRCDERECTECSNDADCTDPDFGVCKGEECVECDRDADCDDGFKCSGQRCEAD